MSSTMVWMLLKTGAGFGIWLGGYMIGRRGHL